MNFLYEVEPPINGAVEAFRNAPLNLRPIRRAHRIGKCTSTALPLALGRGEVSADDVRPLAPILADESLKLILTIFRDVSDTKIFRRTTYHTTIQPLLHTPPLSVWRLAGAALRFNAPHTV